MVPKTPEIRPGTIMEHPKAAMEHSKAAMEHPKAAKELPRTIRGTPGAPWDYPQSVLGAPKDSPRARWYVRNDISEVQTRFEAAKIDLQSPPGAKK